MDATACKQFAVARQNPELFFGVGSVEQGTELASNLEFDLVDSERVSLACFLPAGFPLGTGVQNVNAGQLLVSFLDLW